jgi:hypothetical protein
MWLKRTDHLVQDVTPSGKLPLTQMTNRSRPCKLVSEKFMSFYHLLQSWYICSCFSAQVAKWEMQRAGGNRKGGAPRPCLQEAGCVPSSWGSGPEKPHMVAMGPACPEDPLWPCLAAIKYSKIRAVFPSPHWFSQACLKLCCLFTRLHK